MTSEIKNMDLNSCHQLLIMQAIIEANRQDADEKKKNLIEDLTAMIASMMGQIKFSEYSPNKKDSPKGQDTTILVLDNKRYPPLEGGHSTKIGGMWTLKHDIGSPKSYEILINPELKGVTTL